MCRKKFHFALPIVWLAFSLAGCAGARILPTASQDAPSVNVLKNGDFKSSLEYWSTIGQGVNPYHPADPGRADFQIDQGKLEIGITNPGVDVWSVMVYQSVVLEKGSTYRISFEASSTPDLTITSNITQDVTWTNISGDHIFPLTSILSNYSYEFTMSIQGAALLQFALGDIGIGRITLKNVVIVKE